MFIKRKLCEDEDTEKTETEYECVNICTLLFESVCVHYIFSMGNIPSII